MALPNKEITTTLVANELKVATRDVGTLCTHSSINKWSKHKPVRQPYANSTDIDWWRSQDGDGGISVSLISPLNFVNEMLGNTTYKRPDTNYWKRLGDFRGYQHITEPSYEVEFPTSMYSGGTGDQNAVIFKESGDLFALHPRDVYGAIASSYEDMYLGFALTYVYNGSTNIWVITDTQPLFVGGNILISFVCPTRPSNTTRADLTLFVANNVLGDRSGVGNKMIRINQAPSNTRYYSYLDDGTKRQVKSIAMYTTESPRPPTPRIWEIGNNGWNSVVESYNSISVDVNVSNITSSVNWLQTNRLRYSMNIRGSGGYERVILNATPTSVVPTGQLQINGKSSGKVTMTLPIPSSLNVPYVGEIFIAYEIATTNEAERYQPLGAYRVKYN